MKSRLRIRVAGLLLAVLGCVMWSGVGRLRADAVSIASVGFSVFSSGPDFNNPIGIDFYEPKPGVETGSLLASVNYNHAAGSDFNNLDLINLDPLAGPIGAHTAFAPSVVKNNPEEIKVATVRAAVSSCSYGGFAVGDAFFGASDAGRIGIVHNGVADPAWVNIDDRDSNSGAGLFYRGSLYHDRTCVFGGDLIAVASNEQAFVNSPSVDYTQFGNTGTVWRVKSNKSFVKVAEVHRHLEGVIVVPDIPTKYGPLAGRILAGDEDLHCDRGGVKTPCSVYGGHGRIWAITTDHTRTPLVATIGAPYTGPDTVTVIDDLGVTHSFAPGTIPNYESNLPLHPEDLDLVPQPRTGSVFGPYEGDLFAVDFGARQVLRSAAVNFLDKCGDILVTHEFPTVDVTNLDLARDATTDGNKGLATFRWNFATNRFEGTLLVDPSLTVGHFEHVTFAGGQDCGPQLSVQKTPDNGTFTQGSKVTFTITVSNLAPAGTLPPATNVKLDDTLPNAGGLTWVTATPTAGTCTIAGGNVLHCDLGNIAAQSSVTVTVSSGTTTPAAACTLQDNPIAKATADNALPAQDKGSLTCTPPQLVVNKTPDGGAAGTFTPGQMVSFTIVVSNPAPAGASPATNVVLNDALPGNGGLVWKSATWSQGVCDPIAGNNLHCNLGSIAAGAAATVTVFSDLTTPLSACQAQPNPAATATADGGLTASDSGSLTCTSASLGNFVWNDLNHNGVQDAGEPGIPGVTMTLNGPGGPQSTATDGSGFYQFTNLVAGTYTVTVGAPPAGFVGTLTGAGTPATDSNASPATVVLAAGDSDQTIDFGFWKPASLGNFVWNDLNHNGVQDAGEPGIPGVTMTLNGPGGPQSTATDGSGFYQFTNLVAGTYTVTVGAPPAGFVGTLTGAGTPATDSNASPATVVLAAGDSDQTIDFGFWKPASLGNFVWNDLNHNGVQDAGEPGIPGVTMTLNGPGGPQSTATDGSGFYQFTNLVAGTYTVTVGAPPAGFVGTLTGAGTPATDSNASPATVVLAAGDSDQTIDFGFWKPASLGNFVWNDLNHNGVQDAGEPGIPGVTMTLNGPGGPQSTATDGSGFYQFTNLVAGTYTVTVGAPPAGFVGTLTGAGTPATDSNASPATVVLAAGDSDQTIDFGFWKPASLGNFVWNDLNHNGVQDAGEPGIPGVTMTLNGPGGPQSTATDGSGFYQFTNLVAGTYTVTVGAPPAGFVGTLTGAGTPATDSNASPATVVLAAGDSDQTIDFGFWKPASLGNFVWNDLNHNGVQDAGEPGIPGVTMTLNGPGGPQSTATDGSGFYQFTNLVAGTYTVTVGAPPAGFVGTLTGAGTPATDSNASPATVVLAAGDSDQTIDFGFWKPASLGNFVWNDLNHNGVQDAGEPGIPGVTMTLNGPGGPQSTATDGSGFYQFTNLVAGTYTVTVGAPPAGFVGTLTGAGTPATDSNASPATVVLAAGDSDQTIDFGFWKPASLGNFVWNDLNHNGVQDAGEPGIPGVTMTLNGPGGPQSTATDGSGFYQFTNLVAGTYTVTVGAPPAGFVGTLTGAGTPATDSNASPATVVLAAGDSDQTIDFGFWKPASLGDFVWNDLNFNGQQDVGEPGIDGVLVTLLKCDGTPTGLTQITSGGGAYLFTGLTPGCYKVQFATPAGYTPTTANVGADVTDSDAVSGVTGNYTLASGETNLTVDAGFYKKASLGDFVWNDLNQNGVQDGGEPGIDGVLVTLLRCDGTLTGLTQTTSGGGKYLFTNLDPGCYKVQFGTPAGFTATTPNVGLDAADSDAVAGVTGNYTLNSGDSNITVDAGFYLPVVVKPNVIIAKRGNGPVKLGEQAVFTIDVTNLGPGSATGVVATDTLPAGFTWTDNQAACTINAATNVMTCNIGTMTQGQVFTVVLTATTTASAFDCNCIKPVHHDGDHCDHEKRNGSHHDGDGCDHEKSAHHHSDGDGCTHEKRTGGHYVGDGCDHERIKHVERHYAGDACDHEASRNGHRPGDGCTHEKDVKRHFEGDGCDHDKGQNGHKDGDGCAHEKDMHHHSAGDGCDHDRGRFGHSEGDGCEHDKTKHPVDCKITNTAKVTATNEDPTKLGDNASTATIALSGFNHHAGDGCDHEQHNNRHHDGDGCDHEKDTHHHRDGDGCDHEKRVKGHYAGDGCDHERTKHVERHYSGDGCAHEKRAYGHYNGDSCTHEDDLHRHREGDGCDHDKSRYGHHDGDGCAHDKEMHHHYDGDYCDHERGRFGHKDGDGCEHDKDKHHVYDSCTAKKHYNGDGDDHDLSQKGHYDGDGCGHDAVAPWWLRYGWYWSAGFVFLQSGRLPKALRRRETAVEAENDRRS